MGVLIERLPFYRELILLYSVFTIIGGLAICFFYFLMTSQKPDFWFGVCVFNMVWVLSMKSAIKHSYLQGASDSLKDVPFVEPRN